MKESLYQFIFCIRESFPVKENKRIEYKEYIDGLDEDHPDYIKYIESFAEFTWDYKFIPPSISKISKRTSGLQSDNSLNEKDTLLIGDDFKNLEKDFNRYLRNKDLKNIGIIAGRFYVFNMNSEILNSVFGGQITAIREYVKSNCGVKVYRDNIRVYNYGEPNDDWVNLDTMKVQRTGDHFGKKVTIGAIELDLKSSEKGLVEKTNREGFNENIYFYKLESIVQRVFRFFEGEAQSDREKIEEYTNGFKTVKRIGFSDTIDEIKAKLTEKNLEKEFQPLVSRIEKDYSEMRDIMLNSGTTGLSLGVVFHEVERELKFINSELNTNNEDIDIDDIKGRVKNLSMLLNSISPILRKNTSKLISVIDLVSRVKHIHRNRFNFHDIILSTPILSKESEEFNVKGPENLLITTLSNIIDNSIFWVSAKKDLNKDNYKPAILITTDLNTFDGPAIIIADNGNGFSFKLEDLVQPYKTLKPGGMGLGLYYSNMVMNMIGGKLLTPDSLDLDIPKVYNGACIALVFPSKE